MRFPYRGAGVLLVCGSRFLVGCRAKTPFKGRWAMPGGGREKGETDTRTAVREFREETGTDFDSIKNKEFLGQWRLRLPFFCWTSFIYRVDKEIATKPSEFSELVWLDADAIMQKKLRPFFRSELKTACRLAGLNSN